MAVIFSPITEDELDGPYRALPRHAFLMLHDSGESSELSRKIEAVCSEELTKAGFQPTKATDISGTKDFLEKILNAIRGCGFGVVIFTHETPPATLANIFFEAGIAAILGTPVIVVKSQDAKPPSDFVRTEWISYSLAAEDDFRKRFQKALSEMEGLADYYTEIGEVALDAVTPDYELAFERFKQAYLIKGNSNAFKKIESIKAALDSIMKDKALRSHEIKLRECIAHFIRLAPKSSQRELV